MQTLKLLCPKTKFVIISACLLVYGCAQFQKLQSNNDKKVERASAELQLSRIVANKDLQPENQIKNKFVLNLIAQLVSEGFVCNHMQNNTLSQGPRTGYCRGKIPTYNGFVRIYFDENIAFNKISEAIIFFHGLRSSQTFSINEKNINALGDFGARLRSAKTYQKILIVPESEYGVESYKQFYTCGKRCAQSLIQFVDQIGQVSQLEINKIKLAGHSGAYLAIDGLLAFEENKKIISHVALYDAIYGPIENIRKWIKEDATKKLNITFISGAGASTMKWTPFVIKDLANYIIPKGKQVVVRELVGGENGANHNTSVELGGFVQFIQSNLN